MSPVTGVHTPIWTQRGWASRLAVVALGALTVLAFAPWHIWGLVLVALAGLFVRLVGVSGWDRPGRAGFWTGVLFGLGWFSAGCFWIASAFFERGPEFVIFIPPLVGGLAVVLSLFWGLAGMMTARVMRQSAVLGTVTFVASYGLAELARGYLFTGFPWHMAGYAFEPGGAMSQAASLIGSYGLTSVVLAASALLGLAVAQRSVLPAGMAALGLAGLFVFGAVRLSGATTETQPGVALRLVTVPFRQSEQIDPYTRFDIANRFIEQSVRPGIEDVTHLVWPEGAVPGLAMDDAELLYAVGALLTEDGARPPVWLMNSLRQEISPDRRGQPRTRYYNASVAVTFDAAGNPAIATTDDKRKLVPFGEFIPGGEVVENLGARLISTALGSITPAAQKRSVRVPGLPVGSAQICYEVIFPGLTPRGDRAGPDGAADDPAFILNQSNDAWFGGTIGPDQHAAIARYRAIEEGLPLIRAAANGVTGTFDAYGRALDLAPRGVDGHVDTPLPTPIRRVTNGRGRIIVVNSSLALINLLLLLGTASIVRGFRSSTEP